LPGRSLRPRPTGAQGPPKSPRCGTRFPTPGT
jgi:hypothetical protein